MREPATATSSNAPPAPVPGTSMPHPCDTDWVESPSPDLDQMETLSDDDADDEDDEEYLPKSDDETECSEAMSSNKQSYNVA